MTSNKIFYDTYWRKDQKDDEPVIIVLKDAKIYTILPRGEMFEKGMHHGCFLENKSYETQSEAKAAAMRLTHVIGAKRVTPDEFIELERVNDAERVGKAFALAETMIARA